MKSIYDYNYEQLQEVMIEHGYKRFRARQIYEWLYRKRITEFDQMSNLNKESRDWFKENYILSGLKLHTKQVSKDGTTKFLFELADGNFIETVLMVFDYGNSVCVTSQLGCNMGCDFCASGLLKKQRDLTCGEMVAQIMYVQQELDKKEERVSHIVVMGTGEPFDNYDNVMNFLSVVNADVGLAIGARHITISTCGIVPKIIEFAHADVQYNLAISLHAPNDELRSKLMPINKAYPIEELMRALRIYMKENNRRLTFEYILLKGVNDSQTCAKQLANLLRGTNSYVNLIPYNSVDEHGYQGVNYEVAMKFYDTVVKGGVRATIRKEHGGDIDAACGQLRAKELKREGKI